MQRTITLRATAPPQYGGKEYIARLTGRHKRFVFQRDFLGTKTGVRKEIVEHMTDEPGLYICTSIAEDGFKEETFVLVETNKADGGLKSRPISKEEALLLCRILDKDYTFEKAVKEMWPDPIPPEKQLELFLEQQNARSR